MICLSPRTSGALVGLASLLAVACYRPAFDPCGVRCTLTSGCPSDTECGEDGFCHAERGESCLDIDGGSGDAGGDAGDGGTDSFAPVPRLIGNAYFTNYAGVTYKSPPEMSSTGFRINTDGIVDGDLVLFIANIDNGSNTLWPNPISPGFTQLGQQFYGIDGQTYVVAWKIANGEPAFYAGTYGPGVNSASATLTLIAVSGASASAPINVSLASVAPDEGMSPVVGSSVGVTTTAPHCLLVYATGSDWLAQSGSDAFEPPPGYTTLTAFGDHGDLNWDWTSQHVAYATQAAAGATGTITGSMAGTQPGIAWTAVIAIAPP